MAKVRMSLADAGALLGVAPNSVRSRWKKGQIEGGRDNSGKIWVLLDPAEASTDGATSKASIEPGSNPSIEGSIEPFEGFEPGLFEAQRAHIGTLSGQLARAAAELEALRPRLLEGERARARAAGLEALLAAAREEREAERRGLERQVEELRGRAERAECKEDEARAALAAQERAAQVRSQGFWDLLRRRGPRTA